MWFRPLMRLEFNGISVHGIVEIARLASVMYTYKAPVKYAVITLSIHMFIRNGVQRTDWSAGSQCKLVDGADEEAGRWQRNPRAAS
ncbi:hypothetical protein GWI33_009849 [Rhynchophorus ferrugineus]|uniref:Uncharacterized protein n=1 Tax=Rhynchophorus ferrugineus TaxID=354439 RepID=A0A834M9H3_RHYFE|nr:hypothetical protein GWI33_009849 [Rhynchophorus ferrugineus]